MEMGSTQMKTCKVDAAGVCVLLSKANISFGINNVPAAMGSVIAINIVKDRLPIHLSCADEFMWIRVMIGNILMA
jgi:hypothetical protein